MTTSAKLTIAWAIASLLTAGATVSADRPAPLVDVNPPPPPAHPVPPKLNRIEHAPPVIPAAEPAVVAGGNSGFATTSAFSTAGVTANDQSLSPPVTVSYNGSSPALQVTDTGTGKAIQASINNSANTSSALYGSTNGAGAGLTGYNGGTKGPAGKFGVTNAASAQAGVFATTNGTGPAVLGTVTNPASVYPAIYGMNTLGGGGIGVQGDGSFAGVYATSSNIAVYAISPGGEGVYGGSENGIGVDGESGTSWGVYGTSNSSYGAYFVSGTGGGLYATAATSGNGVTGQSSRGVGVYGSSDSGTGVSGNSTNAIGVLGIDSATGIGIYGQSQSGWAGYFVGKVGALEYDTLSDRNAKADIKPVDGRDLLARIDAMPVSSWKFKIDAKAKEHIGPMAQDFHAAFGLRGDDDTHINLSDAAGISLAAIRELSRRDAAKDRELHDKDARIAALEQKMTALEASVAGRLAALEQREAPTAQSREHMPPFHAGSLD